MTLEDVLEGSSPHTRGARRGYDAGGCPGGIIPAYAGSTAPAPPSWRPWPDHPRIRGEHPASICAPGGGVGIIPAYAGSTGARAGEGLEDGDHPRIRGEHGVAHVEKRRKAGSSPHTRGALLWRDSTLAQNRIIPAYAGSTSDVVPVVA